MVFVYDISDRESFYAVPSFLEIVENRYAAMDDNGEQAKPILFLVGNKTDLDEQGDRAVSTEEAKMYALEKDMKHMEVSAKSQEDNKLFFKIAAELLERRKIA